MTGHHTTGSNGFNGTVIAELRANGAPASPYRGAQAGRGAPETTVEVGDETVEVRARVAQPAGRDVIYSRLEAGDPVIAQVAAMAAPPAIAGSRA